MKKNYNYPKTENVLLTTAPVLQFTVASPTTEPDPMHNPQGDDFL